MSLCIESIDKLHAKIGQSAPALPRAVRGFTSAVSSIKVRSILASGEACGQPTALPLLAPTV
jgi:hypothetical protein